MTLIGTSTPLFLQSIKMLNIMSTPKDVGRAGCEERTAMLYPENIPELTCIVGQCLPTSRLWKKPYL